MFSRDAMSVDILLLGAEDIGRLREEILAVYRAVFSLPPFSESDAAIRQFPETLENHARREGFRCCIARDSETAQIVGFAYGYTGRRGQWWHDLVIQALDPPAVERWMSDVFEVVDLGVIPSVRNRHIGEHLHDRLLQGVSHRTALLSTFQEETPALRLYRKKGWVVIRTDLLFPGVSKPFVILGKDLLP